MSRATSGTDSPTIDCSPHEVFGPQSNDLVRELRKRRIEQVILRITTTILENSPWRP